MYPSCCLTGLFFVFGHGVSFLGGFQCPPVDGCSTASGDFDVLARGDERPSFYSAILMIMEKCRPLKISAPKKKNVPIQAALVVKNPPADAGDVREASLISGWQS